MLKTIGILKETNGEDPLDPGWVKNPDPDPG
jgi:hypothetical protein